MSLAVYLYERRVGTLAQDRESGLYHFMYATQEDEVAGEGPVPLSLSLPLRSSPYESEACRPFFEGLLPEGGVRDRLERNLRVSPGDGFGLLRRIGRDCAGAVVIVEPGSEVASQESADTDWIGDEDLADLIANLPSRPLGVSAIGQMRLSLAGAQNKLTLLRGPGGQFGIPSANRPSTHLIKPQDLPGSFEDLVYNEYFCMSVARACGVETAICELLDIAGHSCLLIERFDRQSDGTETTRLHQEDFCQALGLLPSRKYQSEGGPGFAMIAQALRDAGRAEDIVGLIRIAVINYLLGNSDAHGKNFGLLHHDGSVRLTPAYDLVSTAVYEDLTQEMAMAIGDQTDPTQVGEADWLDFSADCGVRAAGFLAMVRDTATVASERVAQTAARARAEGWHRPVLDRIIATCDARLELIAG